MQAHLIRRKANLNNNKLNNNNLNNNSNMANGIGHYNKWILLWECK